MKHIFRQVILFLNSRYVSYGIRMTIGVTVPALAMALQDQLSVGIIASLGALCVGITDVPGTLSRKRNGMLTGGLLMFVVTFITSLSTASEPLLFCAIILFCFFFSMLSIYGGRASNIGTACLLAMVFSVEGVRDLPQSFEHAVWMLAGGIWYFILSVVLWQIRPYFSARQVLSDCLLETAEYIRIKAAFYSNGPDVDALFRRLVDTQVRINEKQEEVRELLLKRRSAIQGSNSVSRALVMTFIEALDILEQAMASHVDYRLLHERFERTGILLRYRKLILHVAGELENIAAAVVSATRSYPAVNLRKEIEETRHEVDDLREELLNSDNIDGFIALKNILRNADAIARKITNLHHFTHPGRKETRSPLGRDLELTRFTTHQRYDFDVFRSNLTFESSSFRHSLRVTLAAITGYLVSLMIAQTHSYWILMTVIIIMKPAFGSTKKRAYERLLGTVLGGLAGVGVLLLIKNPVILLVILLVCIFLAFTFINYNYRLAVIFITPYVLLLFHLLDPGNFDVVRERVQDTIIGGGIAFLAGYLLWPSWEYTQLKAYMTELLAANREYFRQVANFYTGREMVWTEYKLARKNVHVSTANIASALQRMLTEPKSKQRNAPEIYYFVVLNHTLSSHIATLAAHLQQQEAGFEQKEFTAVIEKSLELLEQAGRSLKGEAGGPVKIEVPEALGQLELRLRVLAERRMNEVKEGIEETQTRTELSFLKLLYDTFSNILNISLEIAKHSQKIHV